MARNTIAWHPLLEGENADLRHRVSELTGEIRHLRELSGLPVHDLVEQKPEDELMPIRQPGRAAKRLPGVRAGSPTWNTVVLISADAKETERLAGALQRGGYELTTTTTATDAQKMAHELSTAALVFDLRDPGIATVAQTVASVLSADPLAKEIPLYALVASAKEREQLQEDGIFTSAFSTPTDAALLVSTLGAAIIRRKTRARRAEAARNITSALVRS